ncbi:MAG: sulfotransferase [Nitrospirales bacterium]
MNTADTYSWLDQILHRVAFKAIWLQKEIADIEDAVFLKQVPSDSAENPVFITSLPRAGTTLLLEVLSKVSVFASHTYRDLPFVFCPMFWNKISGAFQKKATLMDRAHGDGIEIGYDSPEAFEEILWLAFWPEKYSKDRIHPWSQHDRRKDFEHFFRNHIRKIIALRSKPIEDGQPKRYISKNNANVARLALLPALFPNCRIIIPIRNPWDHVKSLLDQHRRFSKLHGLDRFSQEYMEWLGHFEFGAGLRPIDFGDWMEEGKFLDPLEETFWATYWVKAYESILADTCSNMYFFNYDRACEDPASALKDLSMALSLEDPGELLAQATRFRKPTKHKNQIEKIHGSLPARVEAIYKELVSKSG